MQGSHDQEYKKKLEKALDTVQEYLHYQNVLLSRDTN